MDMRFTPEQDLIRDTAAAFLTDWTAKGGFRALTDVNIPFSPDVWKAFGGDLGFAGLTIPEAQGGAGLDDVARVRVMEQMGHVLFMSPFFATCVLASDILAEVGTNAALDLLSRIAKDLVTATAIELDVIDSRQGTISGSARNVINGDTAELFILHAGDRLYAVSGYAAGLSRTTVTTLDPTRPRADIGFDKVRAELVAAGPGLREALDRAKARSAIALAAEQVGGAEAMLAATVAYSLDRKQFGRPVGSFQAVKHRCADMMVAVEAARSAVYLAAAMTQGPALIEYAAIAKSECSDAYFKVAGDAIQMHGGVGVTWDYDLHFHFKRARAGKVLLGTPDSWRERLAGFAGLAGGLA